MRIALGERFQGEARTLRDDQRVAVFEAILALPKAIGEPHRHAGLGLRKAHARGIWEARIGRALRFVFTLEGGTCTLIRVGTHDDVRRYLRSL